MDTTSIPSGFTPGGWIEQQVDVPYRKLFDKYQELKRVKAIRDPRVPKLEEEVKQQKIELYNRSITITRLEASAAVQLTDIAALKKRLTRLTQDNLRLTRLVLKQKK